MKNRVLAFGLMGLLWAGGAVAQLVCNDPIFDFGKRKEGEVIVHTFVLRNQGEKTVVIAGVDSGCSCLSGSPSKRKVAPGEQVAINVRLDLTRRSGAQDRAVYVSIEGSKAKRTTLRLTGESIVLTHVKPRILVFRNVPSGTEHSRTAILYGVEEDLAPGLPKSASPYLACSIRPGTKKGEYILTVLLSKEMPAGRTTAAIQLPIYKNREILTIPVYMAVQEDD